MYAFLWFCSIAMIVAGLAGIVLPVLPGTALVLAGMVLGAWADDFTRVGWVTISVLSVLALVAWALDYVAGLMGAKRAGASKLTLLGAALGTIAGIFMGLIGVFFMPLVGAAVGEYIAQRDERRAMHVGVATWLGIMLGMIAKIGIAFVMIGVFVFAYLT